jgi:hypothetical protein
VKSTVAQCRNSTAENEPWAGNIFALSTKGATAPASSITATKQTAHENTYVGWLTRNSPVPQVGNCWNRRRHRALSQDDPIPNIDGPVGRGVARDKYAGQQKAAHSKGIFCRWRLRRGSGPHRITEALSATRPSVLESALWILLGSSTAADERCHRGAQPALAAEPRAQRRSRPWLRALPVHEGRASGQSAACRARWQPAGRSASGRDLVEPVLAGRREL